VDFVRLELQVNPKALVHRAAEGDPAGLPVLASKLVGVGGHEPDVLDRFEDKRWKPEPAAGSRWFRGAAQLERAH